MLYTILPKTTTIDLTKSCIHATYHKSRNYLTLMTAHTSTIMIPKMWALLAVFSIQKDVMYLHEVLNLIIVFFQHVIFWWNAFIEENVGKQRKTLNCFLCLQWLPIYRDSMLNEQLNCHLYLSYFEVPDHIIGHLDNTNSLIFNGRIHLNLVKSSLNPCLVEVTWGHLWKTLWPYHAIDCIVKGTSRGRNG